jgi:cob(I)alamin adenosyltransferase
VCRRAERRVVALAGLEPVDPDSVRYLNRLADLLFVMARAANHRAGVADTPWQARPRT